MPSRQALTGKTAGRAGAEADLQAAAVATVDASRALLGLAVKSLGPALDRVTLPQFRALVVLTVSGPIRVGDLAQRLGLHQSTLSRTMARLVAAGLVERVQDPHNRRQVIVDATQDGKRLVRTVTQRRQRDVKRILSRVPPDDRVTILRGMRAFADAAGEPTADLLSVLGG